MTYIPEAIAAHWGERCSTFEPECHACRAWAEYDGLLHDIEQLVKAISDIAAEAEWLRVAVERKP